MNTHDEELASLYVLDRLERVERVDFEARMRTDPELLARVREYEAKLALHVRDLPMHRPPTDLIRRIESRIDRIDGITRATPARSITPIYSTVARWGIAAAIALSLSVLAYKRLWPDRSGPAQPFIVVVGLDSQQSTLTELPVRNHTQDSDASFIQLASLAQHYWEEPRSLPTKIKSVHDLGRGYALFDPRSNQGFIGIKQLPPIEAGKRYHLWLVEAASRQVHDAGVLPLPQSNRGLYFFSVSSAVQTGSARVDFFVTAEDEASTEFPRPRGKVVIGNARI